VLRRLSIENITAALTQVYQKWMVILVLTPTAIKAQDIGLDSRLKSGELNMTFPSIHFKHQSTDYAIMPYSVDSCLKYIASHFDENINSLVIWRDSVETDELTSKRIKKLRSALKKYLQAKEFEIYDAGDEQKVSRHTIKMTTDSSKIKYLLTLNSVFDISKTRKRFETSQSHVLRPRVFCWNCIKNGYHLDKKSRGMRKASRRNRRKLSKGDNQ
jgi:REP element-mobilizing transposase RayT